VELNYSYHWRSLSLSLSVPACMEGCILASKHLEWMWQY
jgi:hypothetical protein